MKKHLLGCCKLLFVMLICLPIALTSCGDDEGSTAPEDNSQTVTGGNDQAPINPIVGTWQGQIKDNGEFNTLTYCLNADGTGWDNWNGEKENFTWYTQGDILHIVYKDDSSYGDGYDEDKFRYVINGNTVCLYDLDSPAEGQDIFGVFNRVNGGSQQPVAQAIHGTWKGEVQDNGGKQTVTYCLNADGTGWDDWDGEKENFMWYTQGDILYIVYKDDSPYGDGYDEDKYRYHIDNNYIYIYEMDDAGNNRDMLGVFVKQ